MLHWILHSPMGFIVLLVLGLLILLVLYIVPVLLAWTLNNPHLLGITLLDLLLGWTIIGWIAALVWALASANDASFDAEASYKNNSPR